VQIIVLSGHLNHGSDNAERTFHWSGMLIIVILFINFWHMAVLHCTQYGEVRIEIKWSFLSNNGIVYNQTLGNNPRFQDNFIFQARFRT